MRFKANMCGTRFKANIIVFLGSKCVQETYRVRHIIYVLSDLIHGEGCFAENIQVMYSGLWQSLAHWRERERERERERDRERTEGTNERDTQRGEREDSRKRMRSP